MIQFISDALKWLLEPFDSWTSHQLEVLKAIAVAIGSGLVPVFGLVLTWFARAIKQDAKQARENTSSADWKNGVLVETPVAESAKHAALTSEATRQEISDLGGWVKGAGRRRQPTTELPRQEPYTYE